MNKIVRARFPIASISLVAVILLCAPFVQAAPKDDPPPPITDQSDLNGDTYLDLADLVIFSSKFLEKDWQTVDWCAFYSAAGAGTRFEGKITSYYQKHFGMLLGFIYDHFSCTGASPLLAVKNAPRSLNRIAVDEAGTGNYYISDAKVGSVFIYDPSFSLIGEIKYLSKPLGVAIDSQGYLLVGNNGRDNIEVYDPANGDRLAIFGEGLVQMPNAITVNSVGDIFVTDSKANSILVFDSSYVYSRSIGAPGKGDGQLKFPSDAAFLLVEEVERKQTRLVEQLFVIDQGNHRIQVFDLDGTFIRGIYPPTTISDLCRDWGWGCPDPIRGTFNSLQALDVDSLGRLNVLDIFEAAVSIIDPQTGEILDHYGGWGSGPDNLRSPLDVLITGSGTAVVSDYQKDELTSYVIP